MARHFEQRLNRLVNTGQKGLLQGGHIGLEKETLRVGLNGHIAQTPHPPVFGSALTHPYITTDYSEALLEFITPPFPALEPALDYLQDIHRFVYTHVGEEMLWATSMPCVLDGESSIPIAYYGTSNPGRMKHIYRRGLGYRYGRIMQVIAGVHFNYSLPRDFWPIFQALEQDSQNPIAFRSQEYFSMIRNLQRFGWLIPYLFGASPAVCKSFLAGRVPREGLETFDDNTYFAPFATSLRMSDIGYTNSQEKKSGLRISYNDLDAYIDSLTRAIETPCPEYQKLGIIVDGEYRQLNANILQIENEHYSTVRPKQILQDNEKPSLALKRRGVEYVELRSLDVSPFDPMGINENELRFVEAFLVFCLLHPSPPIDDNERREIDYNQMIAALHGRDPALTLQRQGKSMPLRQWALEITAALEGCCELLDEGNPDKPYLESLALQKAIIQDPERTPSARVLREMRDNGEGFFHFAKRMSQQHQAYFKALPENPDRAGFFKEEAWKSLQHLHMLETNDSLPFADYLQRYFAQR